MGGFSEGSKVRERSEGKWEKFLFVGILYKSLKDGGFSEVSSLSFYIMLLYIYIYIY